MDEEIDVGFDEYESGSDISDNESNNLMSEAESEIDSEDEEESSYDNDNKIIDKKKKPKNDIDNIEEEDEDEEDEEEEEILNDDEDEEEEEEDENEEEILNEEINFEKIKAYKRLNGNSGSNYYMIQLLSKLVEYTKNGCVGLDGLDNYLNTPEEPNKWSEESISFIRILTGNHMFEVLSPNRKQVLNVPLENRIVILKHLLTNVYNNKSVFFTSGVKEYFPHFYENLQNDTITKEEREEIKNFSTKVLNNYNKNNNN